MERFFNLNGRYGAIVQNISDILLNLPSTIFFFCFAVFLVVLSDRQIPAVLYDPVISPAHIHANDSVVVSFKVDRYRVCEVNYANMLVDSDGTRFPLVDLPALKTRKIASGDVVKLGFLIPKGMKPGPAVYKSERQYVCNFTQRWIMPLSVSNPDVNFIVEE